MRDLNVCSHERLERKLLLARLSFPRRHTFSIRHSCIRHIRDTCWTRRARWLTICLCLQCCTEIVRRSVRWFIQWVLILAILELDLASGGVSSRVARVLCGQDWKPEVR